MPIGARRLTALLCATLLAGCGGATDAEEKPATAPGANQPAAASETPKCVEPSADAVKALERTLEVPGRLVAAAGVRAPDAPKPSPLTRGGLYFISARIASPEVKPNTVGTWAANGAFFKTGKGTAAPADFVAGGFAGGSKTAEKAGIDASTIGYGDSRGCQRKR